MAKIYHVDLNQEERDNLNDIISSRSEKSEIVKRSYVLLATDRVGDKNWKDDKIANAYNVSTRTIERLRCRLVEDGLSVALKGKPRIIDQDSPRKFDGGVEAKLIALRCSSPIEGRCNWTLRLLADRMVELSYVESISYESVRQILKKTKLSLGELQNG